MGTGTDAARAAGAGEHADVIDNLKDQLLIVLLRRLGSEVSIPVAEIDGTGEFVGSFSVDENKVFHFKVERKQ